MSSTANQDSALEQLMTLDATLLDDASKFGPTDVLQLSHRLEAAVKLLSQAQASLDPDTTEVHDYVKQLVRCYVAASETAKIARGLEKLLIATGPKCEEFVRVVLGEELRRMLESITTKDLQRVSSMLEQSCMVQVVMSKCVHILVAKLCVLFTELSGKCPDQISREELDRFYITVKLSLQILQVFPEVKRSCWSSSSSSRHRHSFAGSHISAENLTEESQECLAQIMIGIFTVLTSKKWSRDITRLAGAAAALIINSAPSPSLAVKCFFAAYDSIKKGSLSLKVGGLQLSDGSKDAHPSSTLSENRTSEIALIRSVISSASENIIVWDSVSGSSKQPDVYSPFLLRLFPLVCDMCDAGTDYQYWSFQLLSLWYRKLIVSLPALQHEDENFSVLGKGSKVLHETLQRLWVTWDSPVDGVSEFVVDTFRTLLDVWKAEVLEGQSDYEELAEELIVKVLQMPWHSRSRYKPLALLVPAVDTDKLLHEHPYLKAELLRCMGTSFLAALANDVYSAFLHSIRKLAPENQQVVKWRETWMLTVVDGLTSDDSQVRQKTCAYWLPATVKTVPYSGTCLQQHLLKLIGETKGGRNRQTVLFAWITTCRHVRSLVALDIEHLPQDLLVETIYNEEEEICAQAMSLLCGTQKKAEPLKEIEMELLQSSLPYCLKVDSAPFRQQLIASLRKLFVRVRDSCSTAIKRKTGAEFVDPSVDFMDWLYKFTMMNLFPGACFQRRRTCLDIIQAWLETVVFVPSDGAKKGKAQGPTDALLSYARCKGQWDLFSPGNRTFLLYCVTDGADEIQESATHILGKYFPWSPDEPESSTSFAMSEASTVSNISYASDTVTVPGEFATHLLRHGISLCNSPRAYENSSGALLVRIVYDKYVRLQGCRFEVPRRSSVSNISVKMMGEAKDADQGDVCATFFTNLLMKLITKQLQAAETDALNASKHLPIHGIMQALRECIHLEQESPGSICTTDWLGILETAITLATSVITYMLSLLAGGQTDSCPSFAEMGMALDELVASEEGRTEQEEDMSALKPEFQLLLSWSWLNLKESCTCLGEVVAAGTKTDTDPSQRLATETVEGVGDTFLKVLTSCRHRGAIEGCRSGFFQFCMSLMSSEDPNLSSIPANILHQLLTNLENDEMTSSVTRRSAGLPIIVQTVAQAEKKLKNSRLLQLSVKRLYSIALRPTLDQHDQTQDQASVHALNVLKAIFSDAGLSGELLSHLGNAMQLVIQSFESPSWAIRNAATQFVSTLVTRMFGQRSKASLTCNTVTLQEFSVHYPQLLDFVMQKLVKCERQTDEITGVQPSLFLILTLLSSLGPAVDSANSHRLTSQLSKQAMVVMASPVYFLRELSAACVVALTPLDATETCVNELLDRLEFKASARNRNNHIHGTLMCLEKLLNARPQSAGIAEQVTEFILVNTWLVSSDILCPLVRAKCVDVLQRVAPKLPNTSSARGHLVDMLTSLLFAPSARGLQVGEAVMKKSVISLVITLLQSETTDALQDFCVHCIHSDDLEIRTAGLECFPQKASVWVENTSVMACLWTCVKDETDPTCAMIAAKILVTLSMEDCIYWHHMPVIDTREDLQPCYDLVATRARFHRLAGMQAIMFPLEALVLARRLKKIDSSTQETILSSLCEWSDRLYSHSLPHENEDFRMAAAQGLYLAGQPILQYFQQTLNMKLDPVVIRLIEVCLILLDETDSQVRKLATQFVSSLKWDKKNPPISDINSNLCCKVVLAYVRDQLWQSAAVWDFLLNKLYKPGDLSHCLKKHLEPRSQQLFEHEENTFFSEKILQQQEMFETLMVLCQSFKGHIDIVVNALSVLVSELGACNAILEESIAESLVYNLSGDSSVMTSLVGLALQARILSKCYSSSASECEVGVEIQGQLTEELRRLLRIKNIHPALASFLPWV